MAAPCDKKQKHMLYSVQCNMSSLLEHILRVLSCPSVYSRFYSLSGALLSCLSVFPSLSYITVSVNYTLSSYVPACLSLPISLYLFLSLSIFLIF
jgi:hypothetical protein